MKKFYTFTHLSSYYECIHRITKKDLSKPYNFSLALHTNEEPKSIIQNRTILKEQFPHMKFIVANQTHSANITVIKHNSEQGWNSLEDAIEDSDALISNQKNIMLTVLTADCVPIILFDPIQQVIATIHAGWKGTKQAIAFKTIKKMQEQFTCNPKNILAGIAPSIGKCCYEVDWNVTQHFEHIENAYDTKGKKQMLDLPYINQLQLIDAGILNKNIEMSNICTACEVDDYFSYRKEEGCSGRFMSMIGLQ